MKRITALLLSATACASGADEGTAQTVPTATPQTTAPALCRRVITMDRETALTPSYWLAKND